MNKKPGLAIVVEDGGDLSPSLDKRLASIRAADDGAVFHRVDVICMPGREGGMQDTLTAALDMAQRQQADWICILAAGETLSQHAFHLIAPAMQAYDGIWGALGIIGPDGQDCLANRSAYCGEDFLDLCHAVLNWWFGRTHFAKVSAVRNTLEALGGEGYGYGQYLLHIWRQLNCVKTGQPVSMAPACPPLPRSLKNDVLNHLASHHEFITFNHAGQDIKLAYSGRNPTLERVQMRGIFFEERELSALQAVVGRGAVIVDIGANTGNHTVYFAKVMQARRVICFEPNADAIAFLRAVVTANRLDNVDLAHLGKGLGAHSSRGKLHSGRRGHLGTVRFEEEAVGNIEIVPLDTCLDEPVDLIKIDVEDMELDVLKGARHLVEKYRPVLLVEVTDRNIMPFMKLITELKYRIGRVFGDQGYANYLVLPRAQQIQQIEPRGYRD